MLRQTLIERLIAIRKRAGLSKRSLSFKINRSEGYVARVESGDYFPSIEDQEAILTACGSNFLELFYDEFESYKLDMKVFEIVKQANSKEKEAVISILAMMFDQRNKSQ